MWLHCGGCNVVQCGGCNVVQCGGCNVVQRGGCNVWLHCVKETKESAALLEV